MSDYPKYDKDAKCPKCGTYPMRTRYVTARYPGEPFDIVGKLRRVCPLCLYGCYESPLDHNVNTKQRE